MTRFSRITRQSTSLPEVDQTAKPSRTLFTRNTELPMHRTASRPIERYLASLSNFRQKSERLNARHSRSGCTWHYPKRKVSSERWSPEDPCELRPIARTLDPIPTTFRRVSPSMMDQMPVITACHWVMRTARRKPPKISLRPKGLPR